MANIRYNVPCPSCEAEVPIRSTDEVGKKKECPKCKYRFTVPQPPDDAGGDDTDVKPKKAKKDKGKKAKSGNGMLIGVVLGVLALGGLGGAAFFLFGGEDSPKPVAKSGGGGGGTMTPPAITVAPGTEAGGPSGTAEGEKTGDKPAEKSGDKPADTPGDSPKPADATGDKPADKPAPKPSDEKDVTNLLPNDTRAVYRVNMDRLKQTATPLYTSFFDNYVQGLFQTSLTVPFDDVQTYIHCIVDPEREPFGVIRTKREIDRSRLYASVEMEKPASMGSAKKEYFLLKGNPFVDAMGKAFTLKSVVGLAGLGHIIRFPDPPPADPKAKPKRYAICVYDSTTLFIGTEATVERYLTVDLQDNGYPAFKSELTPAEPPPADPTAAPAEGGPAEPGGPGGKPGPPGGPGAPGSAGISQSNAMVLQPPRGMGITPAPGAQGPGGGPQPPGGQRPAARKLYTSVPTYRTVEPALKRLLNQLEEDDKNPPAIIYAEIVDQRLIAARSFGELFRATADPLAGLVSRVQLIGGVISQFDKDKGNGRLALEFVSDDEARRATNENVRPILNLLRVITDASLGMQTTIGGAGTDGGGGPGPGGPGGGGDDAQGAPGGGPPPGGRGGMGDSRRPPGGGRGSPDGGEATGPGGNPNGPTGTFLDDGKGNVQIGQTDRVVTVDVNLNWPETKFTEVLMPRVVRTGGQVRGRLAVQSGESDIHSLAAAAVKLGREKRPFPRGTMEREVKEERYRMPFPPNERVSFLADLLPYLGKAGLRQQIQEKKGAWWGKDNIGAAETWVPEFLVPYYPQDAWRAESMKAEGKSLGGTNYVAPAGVGLEAARYNPADPAQAKKVGITGYDWGSKPEEITDGLSNTVYLLQAAPEFRQPWIAGGGATVRGVDEDEPLKGYAHRAPDGRRGTYALMADGSVRWLPQNTNPAVVKGLITRAGGESLGDLDKLAPADKPKRKESELKGGGLPTPASPSPKATAKIDEAELKKWQGKWKVTFIRSKLLSQLAPGVDVLSVVQMEADMDGTTLRTKLTGDKVPPGFAIPNQTITMIDASASPKVIDGTATVNGKTVPAGESVYEWVGANKVKMRSAEPGKPRPTSVAIPDDKSTDTYVEMERVES